MNNDTLKERLENLKIQQTQLENTYHKLQGAIEFCESCLQEDESPSTNGTSKPKEKVAKAH